MTRGIDVVLKDLLELKGFGQAVEGLALRSLSLSLRAYCNTYAAFRRRPIAVGDADGSDQETLDASIPNRYWDCAFETVVHLQHFCELIVKKVLRDSHWLLTVEPVKDPVLLHQIAHGVAPRAHPKGQRTASAAECLARTVALIRNADLPTEYAFIAEHQAFLQQLNAHRNTLWHRGIQVLRYYALDEFMGRFALPFILRVQQLDAYRPYASLWCPPSQGHGLDVLQLIQGECQNAEPDFCRIAYLKEIARASYASPLFTEVGPTLEALYKRQNASHRGRAAAAAKHLQENREIYDVKVCPVCGTTSLCLYEESDVGYERDVAESYIYEVECLCCSFQVECSLGNPSERNLSFDDWFAAS